MNPMLEKLEAVLVPLLQTENIELVDLTYQKEGGAWILRLFLDKTGGFNLNDCEVWSRRIEGVLDTENLISNSYQLEISSPGVYRVLKKIADFQRFLQQRVKIKLYRPIDGARHMNGIIIGAGESDVVVRLDGNKELRIPLDQIAKANLDPDLKF